MLPVLFLIGHMLPTLPLNVLMGEVGNSCLITTVRVSGKLDNKKGILGILNLSFSHRLQSPDVYSQRLAHRGSCGGRTGCPLLTRLVVRTPTPPKDCGV